MDAQDELSVAQWMDKNGMPKRISDELFVAMGKVRNDKRQQNLVQDGLSGRYRRQSGRYRCICGR